MAFHPFYNITRKATRENGKVEDRTIVFVGSCVCNSFADMRVGPSVAIPRRTPTKTPWQATTRYLKGRSGESRFFFWVAHQTLICKNKHTNNKYILPLSSCCLHSAWRDKHTQKKGKRKKEEGRKVEEEGGLDGALEQNKAKKEKRPPASPNSMLFVSLFAMKIAKFLYQECACTCTHTHTYEQVHSCFVFGRSLVSTDERKKRRSILKKKLRCDVNWCTQTEKETSKGSRRNGWEILEALSLLALPSPAGWFTF